MKPEYKTVMGAGADEVIINKSRFIGHAAPAETEEDALAFLSEVRQKHKTASHNCYAYMIGLNRGIIRYSDDGEPGGTAGMPIVNVMQAQDVTNCCVVVTRYFGGVLLGAGGLTRAYTQGAVIALFAAKVATMALSNRYLFEIPYPIWDRVQHFLSTTPISTIREDVIYAADITLTLLCRASDAQKLSDEFARLSDGRIISVLAEEVYAPWE